MKEFTNIDEVAQILKGVDIDYNGAINYTEFIAATLDQDKIIKEKLKLKDAFNVFDVNKDGKIDEEELKAVLESDDCETFKEMIRECDTDGDGKLDYNEFTKMIES